MCPKKILLKSFAAIILLIMMQACGIKQKALQESDMVEVLRNNMRTQSEWVKVHAAEFLLWGGYPDGVKETFLEEENKYGDKPPYRIGIWRVLAQSETDKESRNKWIEKIMQAYLDEDGSDRLHAIESLAKLKVSPFSESSGLPDIIISGKIDDFSVYKLWSFAYTSEKAFVTVQDSLLKLSVSTDQPNSVRSVSAYALRKLGGLDSPSWQYLAKLALAEQADSPIRINLLNVAIITATEQLSETDLYAQVFKELMVYSEDKEATGKIKISFLDALAEKGRKQDLELLNILFNQSINTRDPETADVLSSVAYAFLMINKD